MPTMKLSPRQGLLDPPRKQGFSSQLTEHVALVAVSREGPGLVFPSRSASSANETRIICKRRAEAEAERGGPRRHLGWPHGLASCNGIWQSHM